MNSGDTDKYSVWLSFAVEKGMSAKRLLNIFGTPEEVYKSSMRSVSASLDEKTAARLLDMKKTVNMEKVMENMEKKHIYFISEENKEYPQKLKNYKGMPYGLYVRGGMPEENAAVAVIGARGCTNYGRQTALHIGKSLSGMGVNVISGMARGIDTYAHRGALENPADEKNGGRTYAVAGCGVDVCYPSENIELYERILERGGIISEYPPGSRPVGWHFPLRNRIISGLSDLVVVVEAREKSGSLITAESALYQGVDVMAVPGRIDDDVSVGCNRLIGDGALVYNDIDDITDYLHITNVKNNEKINIALEKDFEVVYSELGLFPVPMEELAAKTGLNTGKLYEILLELQMRGLVVEPAKNYFGIVIGAKNINGEVSCYSGVTCKGKDD